MPEHRDTIGSDQVSAVLRALDAVKAAQQWTDADLAKELGVSPSTLAHWRAQRNGISAATRWRLRVFLGRYVK